MTIQEQTNLLFRNTLMKSNIKRVFVDGFNKYIVYDDIGTLFVIGFNHQTKKYGFGRTALMMQKYRPNGIPHNIMPDYKYVYDLAKTQEGLMSEFTEFSRLLDLMLEEYSKRFK